MKALKIIGIAILALVAVVFILNMVAPSNYHYSRSIEINAPYEVVYAQVSSLENMHAWSPWAEKDTNMEYSFEGESGTVGSVYSWQGNEEVGKGKQEIISIEENKINTRLTFLEPFESTAESYVELAEGDAVTATWGFQGESPFPSNIMFMFMDMDASIGKEFEKGLGYLKGICEEIAAAPKTYGGFTVAEIDFATKTLITKSDTVSFDGIQGFFEENLPVMFGKVQESGMQIGGPACGLYYTWDEENMRTAMAAGIPVSAEGEIMAPEGFETTEVGGKALHIAYYGDYAGSEKAHMGMVEYMKENGLEMAGPAIEEYVTDPSQEADTTKWLTNIYYLVQ